jgi:hypothetical protein
MATDSSHGFLITKNRLRPDDKKSAEKLKGKQTMLSRGIAFIK